MIFTAIDFNLPCHLAWIIAGCLSNLCFPSQNWNPVYGVKKYLVSNFPARVEGYSGRSGAQDSFSDREESQAEYLLYRTGEATILYFLTVILLLKASYTNVLHTCNINRLLIWGVKATGGHLKNSFSISQNCTNYTYCTLQGERCFRRYVVTPSALHMMYTQLIEKHKVQSQKQIYNV